MARGRGRGRGWEGAAASSAPRASRRRSSSRVSPAAARHAARRNPLAPTPHQNRCEVCLTWTLPVPDRVNTQRTINTPLRGGPCLPRPDNGGGWPAGAQTATALCSCPLSHPACARMPALPCPLVRFARRPPGSCWVARLPLHAEGSVAYNAFDVRYGVLAFAAPAAERQPPHSAGQGRGPAARPSQACQQGRGSVEAPSHVTCSAASQFGPRRAAPVGRARARVARKQAPVWRGGRCVARAQPQPSCVSALHSEGLPPCPRSKGQADQQRVVSREEGEGYLKPLGGPFVHAFVGGLRVAVLRAGDRKARAPAGGRGAPKSNL